ncbi:hypothetical protein G6F68_014477 [Rhizopus microsporus]|nr:hypothetical protein G6F68_014477 [Rhizopus microsporus]
MELLRGRAGWRCVRPREALVAFVLIQLALMARMELTSPLGAGLARRPADWRYFDSQALAQTLHKRATLALGGPVRVISGPPAEGGALAFAQRQGGRGQFQKRLQLQSGYRVERALVERRHAQDAAGQRDVLAHRQKGQQAAALQHKSQ